VIVCIRIDHIIAIIAGAAREEASEADAQQCLDPRERSVVRYSKRHHEQAQGKAKCKFGYAIAIHVTQLTHSFCRNPRKLTPCHSNDWH
jgi:hypothetical protein